MRSRQDKGEFVLANDVARLFFHSGFRPGIGEALKAKRRLIEMRRLFGVADVKLDVIGSFERKKILLGCRGFWLGAAIVVGIMTSVTFPR